ncbi:MAG: putative hemolysin [Rhodobacteraceae bacterium HLUCCA08]|nr:MAG: putative hemolysin [Rhodobacteraceae bacterium HLUCCA08]
MTARDRIDPLIEERAPWLYARRPGTRLIRGALFKTLSYDRTIALAEEYQDWSSHDLMIDLFGMLGRQLQVQGLHHVPHSGPALVVANHPTGIADGIMLYGLLSRTRPDTYFFANKDILRAVPQMEDMIAPVEWRKEKRSHGKTRETMAYVRKAAEQGRMGVIFPSGRLAKRRWLQLHERPWMASAAMLARKFDLPIVPINIRSRNSVLFYLFDRIHPTLRDITLFHEMLNKARQPYAITVGEPISPAALPAKAEDGIAMLRRATLALGDADGRPTVNMVRASRKPLPRT